MDFMGLNSSLKGFGGICEICRVGKVAKTNQGKIKFSVTRHGKSIGDPTTIHIDWVSYIFSGSSWGLTPGAPLDYFSEGSGGEPDGFYGSEL